MNGQARSGVTERGKRDERKDERQGNTITIGLNIEQIGSPTRQVAWSLRRV
jgi:hypothetical protein